MIMSQNSNNFTIDKQTARRLVLTCQELLPPRTLKGKAGVKKFMARVRSIQFDPINVVGRNPDLVLQSRVRDFHPRMLDELLYQDRTLVDNWDKMASLSLTEDWPYFSRHRSRMQDIFGVPAEVVMSLAPTVLGQIKREGPQSSLDFKGNEKTDWGWGPTRVSRAALEGLFKMGQLGVHHRVANRRYFDLIENLLPKDLLETTDPNQSMAEYQTWHMLRRIGSMGLVHPNAGVQWSGIQGVKSSQRRQMLDQLVEKEVLFPIEIQELTGQVFYLRREDKTLLNNIQKGDPVREAALIAPLDNLLWDRKTLSRIFDFDYRWEVYTPKKKRKYGYYVLPVLYGDNFCARVDPEFDKNTRILTIRNWWWEDGVKPDQEMKDALQRCLEDFLVYLDAEGIRYSRTLLKKGDLEWLASLC